MGEDQRDASLMLSGSPFLQQILIRDLVCQDSKDEGTTREIQSSGCVHFALHLCLPSV